MLRRIVQTTSLSVLLLSILSSPGILGVDRRRRQDFGVAGEQRSWVGSSAGGLVWPWWYRESTAGLSAEGNSRRGFHHSTYTRHHAGRRVCTSRPPNSVPHHRAAAGRIRLIYTEVTSSFSCCPGWAQVSHVSFGCNKPSCGAPCLNGGVCTSPAGRCACAKGYAGDQCERDVDECVTEKPCDQLCKNLPGTYECSCRAGYQLQSDSQTCRRNGSDDTAFEARDLEKEFREFAGALTTTPKTTEPEDVENEVTEEADLDQDYEVILKRLAKLEKQVAKDRKKEAEKDDVAGRLSFAIQSINGMRKVIDNVQLMQRELYDTRIKIKQYELEARKIRQLANRVVELEDRLRTRCGTLLPINSGSLNF